MHNYKTLLLKYVIFTYILLGLFSCKPAIGTPWYLRSAAESHRSFYITEIKVAGFSVIPSLSEQPKDSFDAIKKFAEAETYIVTLPPSIEEISAEHIELKAVTSLSKMTEIKVYAEINGDGVPLSPGNPVPVTIKIVDEGDKYKPIGKVIKVVQNEPYDLELIDLNVCGLDATSGSVTIPYRKSLITKADIKARFKYGDEVTIIPIEIGNGHVNLTAGETKDDIRIFVPEKKGQYKEFEFSLSITRSDPQDGDDAALEPEDIYVAGIKNAVGKTASVPINTEKITAADIIILFRGIGTLPVELSPNPVIFNNNTSVEVMLSVPGKAGHYQEWKMPLTIKRDSVAVYNPQDKDGNKKYAIRVKPITEMIDPFNYYTENHEFPASKFDEWVLNMPRMTGIVPSYKFSEGSWSGAPDVWSNEPGKIGSGVRAISNVKVYRYKTRSERWAGGEVPPSNPHDNRFYFYRFTAEAAGGVNPDSSMFCVDRYSKFLFYYSDPSDIKDILGNKVPSDWVDYAAASRGEHIQFTEPFYMTDPVGYVKEDGTVVVYSWVKDKINNSNYKASKNSSFTKPAQKKSSGAGFSPYRENIVVKKIEVVQEENPDYTVAEPLIVGQPKPVRIKVNSSDDPVFTVKVLPAPDGESLSYQWYTNTVQSNESGTPIDGENSPSYSPDKTVETNCYVYCAVTNTNTNNGKLETVKSNAVKLLITDGQVTVDAEQPRIIEQPKSFVIPMNTSKEIKLKVEALSMDKGDLSYQWYKKTQEGAGSGVPINGADKTDYSFKLEKTDTTAAGKTFYYCVVTNTNNNVDGNKTATTASAVATIEVEESYKLIFDKDGQGKITALCDGKLLESGNYVKTGKTVSFFAQAKDEYEVSEWMGVPQSAISENKISALLTVEKEEIVKVVFRKIPNERKLTITAGRLQNIDMGGWDKISGSWKEVDWAYFIYDFRARIYDTEPSGEHFKSLWAKNEGHDLKDTEQVNKAEWLYKRGKGPNWAISEEGEAQTLTKEFSSKPEQQSLQFDTKLVKYDRYLAGTSTYSQYLSNYNQSVIEFNYNKEKDEWSWKKADIPNNFTFNSDFNLSVKLPPAFVLKRGETKKFIIRYQIDRGAPTYAEGTVEVTYTLKWE